MHFNLLLLPDLLAMALMVALLYSVRRRYMLGGMDSSMLGLFFLFLEILAHAFYHKSDVLLQHLLHAAALDCYMFAGICFLSAAAEYRLLPAKTLIQYVLLNVSPLLATLTCYGLGVKQAHSYEAICFLGMIVAGLSTWLLSRNRLLESSRIVLWVVLLGLAHFGFFRVMAYTLLSVLYLRVAVAFRAGLMKHTRGRMVVVIGFACWSLVFLTHPLLADITAIEPIIDQLWNMQKFIIVIGLLVVLLEQQLANRQFEAFHDDLTGLPNRRLFDDRLQQAIQINQRFGGITALLIVDLNGFKQINDSMGHIAGDELLAKMANRLLITLRQTDTVARIGGDEFGIVATGISDMEHAYRVVAKVTQALREPVELTSSQTVSISGAVGLAVFPFDATDVTVLRSIADARMYDDKRSVGRRTVQTPSAPATAMGLS